MRVVKLMNGMAGRSGRVLAGLALIIAGLTIGGTGGLVLARDRRGPAGRRRGGCMPGRAAAARSAAGPLSGR